MHKYPHTVPQLTNEGGAPALREAPITSYSDEHASIAAIFVMHDPIHYYRDLQICMDVLLCPRRTKPVRLYFSNPDFLFSGVHSEPRLAAGAFRVCLEALYKEYTGKPLQYTLFGKPYAVTYEFAEKLLRQQAEQAGCSISRFYGIGDNGASDIRGANHAGDHWSSILVQTGTIAKSTLPEELADYEVACVDAAVDLILKQAEQPGKQ